jgi:hypothetical protein
MRSGLWKQAARVLALMLLIAASGCGEQPTAPKTAAELTEQEKQQLRELNEQRVDEWGKKRTK